MSLENKQPAYDSPDCTIHRSHCPGEVGGASQTYYGKFIAFAALKLKAVNLLVTTAGTATGHKFDVYIGTTSVGSAALSTSTAGATASVEVDQEVSSLQQVSLRSGTDVTGKAVASYEYRMIPSGSYQD